MTFAVLVASQVHRIFRSKYCKILQILGELGLGAITVYKTRFEFISDSEQDDYGCNQKSENLYHTKLKVHDQSRSIVQLADFTELELYTNPFGYIDTFQLPQR